MKYNIVQIRYYTNSKANSDKVIFYQKIENMTELVFQSYVNANKLYIQEENNDKTTSYSPVSKLDKYNSTLDYYEPDSSLYNYPIDLTDTFLFSGSVFKPYLPAIKISIQTLPGTKFRINSNYDWIMVGASGVYNLDLTDTSASISELSFEPKSIDKIKNNPNAYLFIDLAYQSNNKEEQ